MKKTEKILALIAVIGVTLRILLINGGGFITVISLSTISLLYFLLSFVFFNDIPVRNMFRKQSYQGISRGRIVGSIVLGFILSTLVNGILFRIQIYKGSQFLLITGLTWLIIPAILVMIKLTRTKNVFYKEAIARIAIIGFIGLVLCIIPNWRIVSVLSRKHPAYVEAVKNLSEDPENKALQDEVQRQREIICAENEKNEKK